MELEYAVHAGEHGLVALAEDLARSQHMEVFVQTVDLG